ncbi:MAG: hypothetical protein U0R69_01095 [Gaiellales bacterium]
MEDVVAGTGDLDIVTGPTRELVVGPVVGVGTANNRINYPNP